MSRPIPPAYKTRNWPAYNEALKRRGSLTIWFDPAMTWEAVPTGRRGRQRDYGDAAIQTCLTIKVLFGMAARGAAAIIPPRKNAKPWKPDSPERPVWGCFQPNRFSVTR